jgi:uncharacterized RDD family membrane protein YckC
MVARVRYLIRPIAVLLVLGVQLTAARAQTLTSSGDASDLWLLIETTQHSDKPADPIATQQMLILHRRLADAPNQLRQVAQLRGRVSPAAAACSAGRLWLVFDDLAVRALDAERHDPRRPELARLDPASVNKARLPDSVELLALAANRHGPWALVRVMTRAALRAIDDDQSKPGAHAERLDEPAAVSDADQTTAAYVPLDRLLRLDRDHWVRVDLPTAWPVLGQHWLVFDGPDEPGPLLMTLGGNGALSVHSRPNQTWDAQTYSIGATDAAKLQPLVVSGQLVIGRLLDTQDELTASIAVLRGGQVIDLGVLSVPGVAGQPWTLVPSGAAVALVVGSGSFEDGATDSDHPEAAQWAQMDLSGSVPAPATALTIDRSALGYNPGQALVVSVLAVSMLLMLSLWRRDPQLARLALPKGVALAPLHRRALAAAIDLAPCMAVVAAVFRVDTDQMMISPAVVNAHWIDMLPALVVIGLNVTHTALTEMFTGRSLGKWVCQMRVVSLDGKPPDVWQALGRNLMRSFDLIAWYILPIMMVLGPYRQRLGDMAARTLVVTDLPAPTPEADDKSNEQDQ